MHHKTHIDYKNGLQDLVNDIGDLRYDALETFIELFSEKIAHDAILDQKRGRTKLANELIYTAQALKGAQIHMNKAWNISKPFMKEDGSC
jgi:hypothetical protein